MTKTAQLADVSSTMISKVMSAWNSEGKTSSAKSNSRRKRILQERDICALIQSARQSKRATADQLTVNFNLGHEQPVSQKMVRQELHRAGYHSRVSVHKPLITSGNALLRVHSSKRAQAMDYRAVEKFDVVR